MAATAPQVSIRGTVDFQPFLAPRRAERDPVLHWYVSSDVCERVERLQVATETRQRVDWQFPARVTQLPADARLNVDMFTELRNHTGQWCRVKAGSAMMLLRDMEAAYERAARSGRAVQYEFDLTMPTANNFEKGRVKLTVQSPVTNGTAMLSAVQDPGAYVPETMQSYERMLRRNVTANLSVYDHLRPTWKLIAPLHAPYYQSRVGTLPGPLYGIFANDQVRCTEAYLQRCLRTALARRSLTVDDFMAMDTRKAAVLLGETAAVYANYCPYMPDEVNKNRRRTGAPYLEAWVQPVESFDVMRVRDAGDCEDSAREIALTLNEMLHGTWQSPEVRRLQALRRNYVCVMALAGVTSAALSGGNERADVSQLRNIGGHMFTMLWPVAWTLDMVEADGSAHVTVPQWMRDARVSTQDLDVMVLEGTGKLVPEPQPHPARAELKALLNRQNAREVMGSYRQTMYWDRHRESSFYKSCTSVFTNDFMRPGDSGGVAEFVITRADATYGARFLEIVNHDPVVGLLAQPAFTANELKMLRRMTRNEHPLPVMDAVGSLDANVEPLDAVVARVGEIVESDDTIVLEMYTRREDLTEAHCGQLAEYLAGHPQVRGVAYRAEPITAGMQGVALRVAVTRQG